MAALAVENERLAADASGVRASWPEEQARGKAYTAEERKKRVAELQETLARIGTSTDPLLQEARRRIDAGDVAGGQAKLDEALDADEKAIAEAERVAAERRKAAAQSARNVAVLARGTDVVKAVAYFQRATRLDPSDAETWNDYAEAAKEAGRTDEAKAAFEQAVARAGAAGDARQRYWATLGLGDIAFAQGSLPEAARHYGAAAALPSIVKADRQCPMAARPLRRTSGSATCCSPGHLARWRATGVDASAVCKPTAMLNGSAISPGRTSRSATCSAGQSAGGAGELPPSSPSPSASPRPTPAMPSWQRDLSASALKGSATCSGQGNLPGRWRATTPLSPSPSASPRPTPEMPDGSATSPSRKQDRRRAGRAGQPAGGARAPTGLPRHHRTPRQGRPRKCRMAARPLRLA